MKIHSLLPISTREIPTPPIQSDPLEVAEEYFRHGIETFRRLEGDRYFTILSHSLLALAYSRKMDWPKALSVGETALSDARSCCPKIVPICELIMENILTEFGKSAHTFERVSSPGADLFTLRLFGPIRIFHHHIEIQPNSWRTVKSRDLLVYLAHQNKPINTDQILEDLWPDYTRDKAGALFHTSLYYLRRLLQRFTREELIIYGAKRYQLQGDQIRTDRFQFEKIAQQALKSPLTENLAPAIESALLLYQGDYLEELDYPWVVSTQEELKNLGIALRQKLADFYEQRNQYSQAIIHLRHLLALKPYSEELLSSLLTALAAMEDWPGIKKEFAQFTHLLREDLGLRPSDHLTALYQQYVRH